MTNISGASVSCRMQLTTTSCSASTSTSGATSRRPWASVRPGFSGSGPNWSIRTSANARVDGRDGALGEDRHLADAEGRERPDARRARWRRS